MKENLDLISIDRQMPGRSGATVARMVPKAKPDLSVIVVTAIRDDEVAATRWKFQVVEFGTGRPPVRPCWRRWRRASNLRSRPETCQAD